MTRSISLGGCSTKLIRATTDIHEAIVPLLQNTRTLLNSQIPRAEPDRKSKVPLRDDPFLQADIPKAHVPPVQRERHVLSTSRLEERLSETPQDPHRRTRWRRALRECNIQLRHCRSGVLAHVLHFNRDRGNLIPQVLPTAGDLAEGVVGRCLQVRLEFNLEVLAELEFGVREAESELVQRFDVVGVEMLVIDQLALREVRTRIGCQASHIHDRRAVIGFEPGDRVWQSARWFLLAPENIDDRVANFFAGIVGREDGRHQTWAQQ
jgi:hypothetical protein